MANQEELGIERFTLAVALNNEQIEDLDANAQFDAEGAEEGAEETQDL